MTDDAKPSRPDTLQPPETADTLPPPAGDELVRTDASNAAPHPLPETLPAKTRWFTETLEEAQLDRGRYQFSDGSTLNPGAVDWRRYRELHGAGDELPSPRASIPPMLTEAHVRILQLPVETIEALLQVVAFLKTTGRGVRFDSLPNGAIDVMLTTGLGSPEDALQIGHHVSRAPEVETALGEAIAGAFFKLGTVR